MNTEKILFWQLNMENQEIKLKESHLRSVAKGFSYRIISTFTTIVISYLIIGNIGRALEIGFLEFMLKIFIYYLHERLWLIKFSGIIFSEKTVK